MSVYWLKKINLTCNNVTGKNVTGKNVKTKICYRLNLKKRITEDFLQSFQRSFSFLIYFFFSSPFQAGRRLIVQCSKDLSGWKVAIFENDTASQNEWSWCNFANTYHWLEYARMRAPIMYCRFSAFEEGNVDTPRNREQNISEPR